MGYVKRIKKHLADYPKCETDEERLKLLETLYKNQHANKIRKEKIRERYDKATCLECGTNNLEIIVLKDDVWKQINPDIGGWVCLKCMEKKSTQRFSSLENLEQSLSFE